MRSYELGARRSRVSIRCGLWWVLVLGASCSGKLPGSIAPSSCDDRCGALNCPPDTHCTVTNTCGSSCVPDILAPR
jgi:hypothetical protein